MIVFTEINESMSPSGLAQRYLAAIQNNDKEQWQPDSLQLSSSSESTYSKDNDEPCESLDNDLCYFQTRNGSNSPSRLRIRDSYSCHSRDSVSSEDDLKVHPMVLDEYKQTQNKWKNFRNTMKQRSAAATIEKNDETYPASMSDHDEAVSDAYPPTEVTNNVSMQWKQKELNAWKHNVSSASAAAVTASPTLARFKQGTKDDRGWIRKDDNHFTTKKQVSTHSISSKPNADLNVENDSMDNKNIPQHKVPKSVETNHGSPTSSSSQVVSSPWAVKLRPVKNTKSSPSVLHDDKNDDNIENNIPTTCNVKTEEMAKEVHHGNWKGRKTTNYSNIIPGTNSNSLDNSWIKTNAEESNDTTPQSPKKEGLKGASLIGDLHSMSTAPSSPVVNCQSPIPSSPNLRGSTSWIKSPAMRKAPSPQPSKYPIENFTRTSGPDRTQTQHLPPVRPRNEKGASRRSLSLSSMRNNSTLNMERNTTNFDVSKQSTSDVEAPTLSPNTKTIGKTMSEIGVPISSVRNIRSLFEMKSTNDRPPSKQIGRKGNDNDVTNDETKTDTKRPTSHAKNEAQHFAPKTLNLIKTNRLMVHNCITVDQKQNALSTVTHSSCVPERNTSRKTSGILSLKSKFESPLPSKFNASKSYTQKVTEYEEDLHQAPTDETDGAKSIIEKSEAANMETDAELENAGKHSYSFENLRSKFDGSNSGVNVSNTNTKLSKTFSGGESTFNSLCIETQSPGDEDVNSIAKVRPIPQKPNNDIGKQSAFTAYQQRPNISTTANEILVANDIPWDSRTPNDIPWHDRELQDDKVDSYMHEISMLTDKRVIDMSYGIEYLDCSLDDDDGDGVTLSPNPSDVSSLSIPSCIQSLDAITSDDDTGAIESITEKQSSVLGPSEASSSQMSESAKPLIYSALGTMGRKFPMKSSSDTSQSFSVQYTGLLNALPSSIDNSTQVNESEHNADNAMFFLESKDQKSRESTAVNNQFEDELRVHPGLEWKNDLFAIDSVKSHTSGDDIRWTEFPDTNFDGYHGSNTTLSGENHSGSFGVVPRKTAADTGSKSSRSTPSPKPGHKKTISSERIKTPTLPVVRECNLESSAIKHRPSLSSDAEKVVSMEASKESTDGRVSAYRRFNIQKVRAFQQFRRSKSYNN